MKRAVVCSLVVGTLLSGGVGATEMLFGSQDVQRWQGGGDGAGASQEPARWTGGAIGAIAGALVAGPPGFIVGAAGGVLVERNAGLESDLHTLRQEVSELRERESDQRQRALKFRQQLGALEHTRQRQLRMLADAVVYSVRFRSDRARPEPADVTELKRLATALKGIERLQITLHAHADRRGSQDYNRRLSEERAQVVRELLLDAGVASQRIHVRSEGEAAARYPETDREGLGFDRRVEIRFHYGETP